MNRRETRSKDHRCVLRFCSMKRTLTATKERVRLATTILLATIVLAGLVIVSRWKATETSSIDVKIIGPEEVVFDWSKDACEPNDFPDVPARAFWDGRGRVQLIASHYISRRMIGPDLNHLAHDCAVLMSSDDDPDPARFADREWIHSVYTLDGITVFALIHNEYQGHTHPGRCPSGMYQKCWYNSITLAISNNGGDSYNHAQPPTHLVASLPYTYVPDSGPLGVFNTSNIVHYNADGYYYALVHLEQYRAQPSGTCVMRSAGLADPTSWRAWDGTGFNVRFINPYLEPANSVRSHLCQPISRNEIQKMTESLTFNTYLNRFLLVGTAGSRTPAPGQMVWGIYYSLSDDLIHWTPRQLIMETETPWSYQCGDSNPILYPAVLDPKSSSRNFETTGKQVYLYFTRFNYASCKMTSDRDLVRIPIEFSK
jgi:hypothetical protein